MKTYYETKAETHHKQWEVTVELGKEIAAKYHMQEYLNYQQMIKQINDL